MSFFRLNRIRSTSTTIGLFTAFTRETGTRRSDFCGPSIQRVPSRVQPLCRMRHSKWIRKRPVKGSEWGSGNEFGMNKCISHKKLDCKTYRESFRKPRRRYFKGSQRVAIWHWTGRGRNKGVKFRPRINHGCLRENDVCARACVRDGRHVLTYSCVTNCAWRPLPGRICPSIFGALSASWKVWNRTDGAVEKEKRGIFIFFFCSSPVAIWSRARRDETPKTK